MARTPYFEVDQADGELKKQLDRLPALNIFRMLAHSPDMMQRFVQMGNQILLSTQLDGILREIAIIRVGVLSKASYEVYQHERIGREMGMSDALIAGIHEGPEANIFTEAQRKVMAFTDDVVLNVRASDATFDPLQDFLSPQEINELLLTIGYYMMVSRFLETMGVDIEDADVDMSHISGN